MIIVLRNSGRRGSFDDIQVLGSKDNSVTNAYIVGYSADLGSILP